MMTRCASCNSSIRRVKDVKNLRKVSLLNSEFNCPYCNAKLTTSCVWHEVQVFSVLVTVVVLALFSIFQYVIPIPADGLFNSLKIATTLVLIIVMLVPMSKTRTRQLN